MDFDDIPHLVDWTRLSHDFGISSLFLFVNKTKYGFWAIWHCCGRRSCDPMVRVSFQGKTSIYNVIAHTYGQGEVI